MSDEPPHGSLGDVQSWMRARVWARHAQGGRSLVVEAATGTGKTYLAGRLAREAGERFGGRPTLFLAHRKELLEQAADEFDRQGLVVLEEIAHKKAYRKMSGGLFGGPDVVVASKDSLHKDRILYYRKDAFGLCVTDECHLSDPESYRHIYRYFDFPLHLGLSATPFRMDGEPVYGGPGSVFTDRACRYSLKDAIRRGHLCPVRSVELGVGIDLTGIRMSGRKANDLDPQDLELRVMAKLGPIANAIRQEVERYGFTSVLIFAPDVRSSVKLANALQGLLPRLVVTSVHGADEDRDAKVHGFKSGQINVLVNCDLLTTGFNHPPTQAIFLAVATKSLVKFIQCVGRGTRTADGKQFCYVFGFSWMGCEGLCSSVDLFLEDWSNPEVRRRAEALLGSGKARSPLEAAEQAEAEVAAEERKAEEAELEELLGLEVRKARDAVKRQAIEYTRSERVPFGTPEGLVPFLASAGGGSVPATAAQVAFLRKKGVRGVGSLTTEQARAVIDQISYRECLGLATPAQVDRIVACGCWYRGHKISRDEAEGLTKQQATSLLLKTWRRPPRRQAKGA